MNLGLRSKLLILFATLALFIAGNFVSGKITAKKSSELLSWVIHTRDIIEQSEYFLGQLRDAETGQRGYLLTSRKEYLEPYNDGIKNVHRSLQTLKRLTADNPQQQARLVDIEKLMNEKLAELKQTIQLNESGRRNESLAIVNDGQGRRLMGLLRVHISSFGNEASRLLEIRQAAFDKNRKWYQFLYSMGAAIMVLIACAIAFYIQTRIINPINLLKNDAIRFGKDEILNHPVIRTNDEIGELSLALDNMQHKVRSRAMELRNAQQEAVYASQAKSMFLSNMSHELRTPLNAILGFAQLLERDTQNPMNKAQSRAVKRIIDGGKHLLILINDILDLSKIEAGGLSLSIERISARNALKDCLIIANDMADKYGIVIESGDVLDSAPNLNGDYTRFKQVILNLLSNAIKYNNENGKVFISYREVTPGYCRFFIRDTGKGISAEKQEYLFTPFSRLGAENSKIEGTGIGLSITNKLVDLMHGKIGVESTEGKGTTFWVEFPLAEDQSHHEDDPSVTKLANESATTIDLAPCSVLYIEDNPTNVELMEMMLGQSGNIDLVSSHTAELGITQAEENPPDLILMDINLPGMDGIKACKAIRANHKLAHIPVVAISANAMPREIKEAMAAGFDDYITKPIQLPRVNAILNRHLCKKGDSPLPDSAPSPINKAPELSCIENSPLDPGAIEIVCRSARTLTTPYINILKSQSAAIPELLQKIKHSIDEENSKAVETEAHKLKTNSRTLGGETLATLAQSVESMAKEKRLDEASKVLSEMALEYQRIEPAINELLDELSEKYA